MKRPQRRHRKPSASGPAPLERINPNAAGIDCGAAEHYVAVPVGRDATPVRSFATVTDEILEAPPPQNLLGPPPQLQDPTLGQPRRGRTETALGAFYRRLAHRVLRADLALTGQGSSVILRCTQAKEASMRSFLAATAVALLAPVPCAGANDLVFVVPTLGHVGLVAVTLVVAVTGAIAARRRRK
jgi:hypothetical protein